MWCNSLFFLPQGYAMGEGARDQAPTVEACRGMPQHLFLGTVGGGFEACRSTLTIGLGLFREKIWNQNINPTPLQLLLRDGQSPSAPGVTRGHTVQKEMGSTLVVKRCICD